MAPTRYPGEEVSADPLGAPLDYPFSGKSAPNRFLKAAMAERLSSWSPTDVPARGIPSPELINAYRRWGEGGFGTILTGNTMIDYENLEAAGNPILPRDATFSGPRFDAFREMAHAAKSGGGLVLVQLSHPGRQVGATLQKHPISASDVQLEPRMGIEFAKPRPATEEDLRDVIESFAHAAEFASKAGYDGVQLHGAQYVSHPMLLGCDDAYGLCQVAIFSVNSSPQPRTIALISMAGRWRIARVSSLK